MNPVHFLSNTIIIFSWEDNSILPETVICFVVASRSCPKVQATEKRSKLKRQENYTDVVAKGDTGISWVGCGPVSIDLEVPRGVKSPPSLANAWVASRSLKSPIHWRYLHNVSDRTTRASQVVDPITRLKCTHTHSKYFLFERNDLPSTLHRTRNFRGYGHVPCAISTESRSKVLGFCGAETK